MGHFLSEALRANLVTKEPFLQHGAINPTGPSPSTEVRCSQGDLLLVAGYGHHLIEHISTIGIMVKMIFLGDASIQVLLAEDVSGPKIR